VRFEKSKEAEKDPEIVEVTGKGELEGSCSPPGKKKKERYRAR